MCRYAFGEGLSYTTFDHSAPTVSFVRGAFATIQSEALQRVTLSRSAVIGSANVTVRNSGERAGAEVVLLFAAPPVASGKVEDFVGKVEDFVLIHPVYFPD